MFLQWENLDFKVKDKNIITSNSGIVKEGEFVAIMGPSGIDSFLLLSFSLFFCISFIFSLLLLESNFDFTNNIKYEIN